MRVLITNLFLDHNSGSEAVAEMLADGLRRAGHTPMLYASLLGPQAERMRARGHFVTDRLSSLPDRPDVIHAQHVTPALMAIIGLPETPVLYACHSARFVLETPIRHPNVARYVAVDDLCRDRCLADGIPADRLSVVLNAVDLERFAPRSPLPERPARALLITKGPDDPTMVRAACIAAGLALEEVGPGSKRFSVELERDLLNYDIVFATARGALEAAVVGCSVVVCDRRGFAGLLTSENLEQWRRMNFGAGLLTRPNSVAALTDAIEAYDAMDADLVSGRLRTSAGLDDYVARHLELYAECMAEPINSGDRATAMANARLLEDLLPTPTDRPWRQLVIEKNLYPARTDEVMTALSQRIRGEAKETRTQNKSASEDLRAQVELLREDLRNLSASVAGMVSGRPPV
jgi:hypothetical protein